MKETEMDERMPPSDGNRVAKHFRGGDGGTMGDPGNPTTGPVASDPIGIATDAAERIAATILKKHGINYGPSRGAQGPSAATSLAPKQAPANFFQKIGPTGQVQ